MTKGGRNAPALFRTSSHLNGVIMGMHKPFIVVDIDGTCGDLTHRLHHIKGDKKDWDAFYGEVRDDIPHEDVRELLRAISGHFLDACGQFFYVTGRMERCREDTQRWLLRHRFPYGQLLMRTEGDHRPDYIVKGEIADELGLNADNVWFVLDDRKQVVEMWRKRGIRVLQVAEGDY